MQHAVALQMLPLSLLLGSLARSECGCSQLEIDLVLLLSRQRDGLRLAFSSLFCVLCKGWIWVFLLGILHPHFVHVNFQLLLLWCLV